MGLEQVVQDVRQDGEARAKQVIDDAKAEAKRIEDEAKARAAEVKKARKAQAEKDAQQLAAQLASGAEFEARKQVLEAEAALRKEFRTRLVEAFTGLPADRRATHVKALLKEAQQTVPSGKVWGAAKDADALKEGAYTHAGDLDIAGGIVVESDDGTVRLDLSYETILADLWRDVLRQEAELFR